MYESEMPIILASSSPRRKHLLEQAGIAFQTLPGDVDEEVFIEASHSPSTIVESIAEKKAERAIQRITLPEFALLAADTIVTVGNKVLGKPKNITEARAMLSALSGRIHRVWTGVCVVVQAETLERRIWSCCTEVAFRKLSPEEIEAYILTGEPFDKAGGYGIQGRASVFVTNLKGSYTNVVGLPLAETIQTLIELKIIRPRTFPKAQ